MAFSKVFFSSFALASALPGVVAQLASCKDVNCPDSTTSPVSECTIGNETLSMIGVGSTQSKISDKPLTWTVGVGKVDDPDLKPGTWRLDRNYYLGTPSSLDLKNEDTYGGCALFFDELASSLRFPDDSDKNTWSCGAAMDNACLNDLLSIASDEFKNMNKGNSSTCADFGAAIQQKVPESCYTLSAPDTWGTISSKEITGSSYPGTIEEGDCHPTTEEGYSLSLIKSDKVIGASRLQENLSTFNAITPVMTVFYSRKGSDSSPETSLTCLKPVEDYIVRNGTGASGSERMDGKAASVGNHVGFAFLLSSAVAILFL